MKQVNSGTCLQPGIEQSIYKNIYFKNKKKRYSYIDLYYIWAASGRRCEAIQILCVLLNRLEHNTILVK